MENLQSVMFTCMDITMAPGGVKVMGGTFSGPICSFSVADWWISSKRKTRESITERGQNKSGLS